MGRLRTSLAVGLSAAAAGLGLTASAQAALPGLDLGFTDIGGFQTASPADAAITTQHARSAGASIGRIFIYWSRVAPTKPPSLEVARDPAWSGYDWTATDQAVRNVAASGLRIDASPYSAPDWAEGAGRPPAGDLAPKGTWRPSPAWYGAFATALAKRYSGTYPDPLQPGTALPAVRDWEAWNEPNLSTYLSPQWTRAGGTYRLASPAIYRRLNNAFYAAMKAVDRRNVVITAGTAPFGDLNSGDPRVMPLKFWRALLCVTGRGAAVRAGSCPVLRFDAYNHHPYPIGPPRRRARNADDVVVPDVHKITELVTAAQRRGTVQPRGTKPLWVTEMSWDSAPDPDGLPLATQAQYLAGALYVLWRQGVDDVVWWQLRDDAPRPSYDTTYQSGIFLRGATPAQDTPKPSFTAFRFPFTAYRSSGVATLWGKSSTPNAVVAVQAQSGGAWRTVTRVRAQANGIFSGRLRVGRGTALRAVSGTDTSLSWTTE